MTLLDKDFQRRKEIVLDSFKHSPNLMENTKGQNEFNPRFLCHVDIVLVIIPIILY